MQSIVCENGVGETVANDTEIGSVLLQLAIRRCGDDATDPFNNIKGSAYG